MNNFTTSSSKEQDHPLDLSLGGTVEREGHKTASSSLDVSDDPEDEGVYSTPPTSPGNLQMSDHKEESERLKAFARTRPGADEILEFLAKNSSPYLTGLMEKTGMLAHIRQGIDTVKDVKYLELLRRAWPKGTPLNEEGSATTSTRPEDLQAPPPVPDKTAVGDSQRSDTPSERAHGSHDRAVAFIKVFDAFMEGRLLELHETTTCPYHDDALEYMRAFVERALFNPPEEGIFSRTPPPTPSPATSSMTNPFSEIQQPPCIAEALPQKSPPDTHAPILRKELLRPLTIDVTPVSGGSDTASAVPKKTPLLSRRGLKPLAVPHIPNLSYIHAQSDSTPIAQGEIECQGNQGEAGQIHDQTPDVITIVDSDEELVKSAESVERKVQNAATPPKRFKRKADTYNAGPQKKREGYFTMTLNIPLPVGKILSKAFYNGNTVYTRRFGDRGIHMVLLPEKGRGLLQKRYKDQIVAGIYLSMAGLTQLYQNAMVIRYTFTKLQSAQHFEPLSATLEEGKTILIKKPFTTFNIRDWEGQQFGKFALRGDEVYEFVDFLLRDLPKVFPSLNEIPLHQTPRE